ncbi:hypothetical protein QUF72_16290 [Desulfobacterales bacterium HSG2]|nr:hypothetical protein [Desulfobacterales bacterium HSG2]
MKARMTLRPGQKGTLKLAEEYGGSLIYVRYRYDEERKKRIRTAELIADETEWEPQNNAGAPTAEPRNCIVADSVVGVRVGLREKDMRTRIKKAGGKWDRKRATFRLTARWVRNALISGFPISRRGLWL